ncbi:MULTISPECIES: aldehyde dehydrogenase [unclassified Bacillus (in: firmicutes)]|uniref:aldehyde dehydrogenase family protein n=1 Tax=unclassified Bacillus (in: firmicutes) TaxID=185979 RepID=UPI0008EDC7ED|nr:MULTISPECIES: aldehyde dehydrogenase family protein [unclassified Bacillus (in: firmicutes)]SFA69604.1 aldehyde dehydrogenase (NAD+) [Bacillus sp. UNCCL13]SFQ58920.1 aldehyde dehydrogenase (NAD+) [Bacillus sp. cl95]
MLHQATKKGLYINGVWTQEDNQDYFQSTNPATGEVEGYLAVATPAQIDQAVESAKVAFKTWKNTPLPERAQYLWKAAQLFEEKKQYLAETMTKEMGKVLAESLGEVGVVVETCKYMAGEGRRLFGETVSSGAGNRHIMMVREPVGVVACITPWNFPVALAGYKILAALISGNTIVWKPASEVALSAQIFTEVFHEVGLPKGVLNLITGAGSKVGAQLAEHKDVKVISFTGSTEVGIKLSETAAKTLKRVSLELGGKNACIVLKDADLDLAAEAIVKAAFTTTGQRCTAASRVIVESDVKEELLNKVVAISRKLKAGNGLEAGVDIGPLTNRNQLETVEKYVSLAVQEGAVIECGGRRLASEQGYFYEPTVLSNVKKGDSVAQEEIFGPILAFIEVNSFEEAIEVNNDTIYGLSTSLFTSSLHFANRGAKEIESGLVYINNGTSNAELGVAFGGTKQSGNGHREVSHHAFDVMTEWKSIYTTY